jgi:FixJ family two-component response regulator
MNKYIAAELGTGEQNIKIHRRRLIQKMEVKSLAELVRLAERLGVEPMQ